jgi:Fic family protein
LLCLSLFLKSNRQTYYDLLQRVRLTGDWESWVEFFLEGVRETADQAVSSAREILALIERDRRQIESEGRSSAFMLRLHHHMTCKPITTIARAALDLGSTRPTVASAVEHMQKLNILKEITNRRKGRVFAYESYLRILAKGTEPVHAG